MSLFRNLNISSDLKLEKKTSVLFYFLLASFLLSTVSYAQEVKVEVDTMNIRIGEQFKYQISVNDTANVIIPKLENLKGLEIVEDIPTDTLEKNLIKKYLLTGFDSGAFYIPSQQVFIRNRAYITDSILINVATVAIDTTKQKMFPIKAIQSEPFTFDDFIPYLIWVILGLLLIAGLIYYLKTRKKDEGEEGEVIRAIPAFEEAIAKLKELDEKLLWQNNKIKQYYTELTEIIQDYLGKDVEIPTLELTSSEIIELVETQNSTRKLGIERDTLKNLTTLFKHADLVKFAKSKPISHEIEGDRKLAEKIISNIQPKIKEYRVALAEEQGIVLEEDIPASQPQVPQEEPKWYSPKKYDKKKLIATFFTMIFVSVGATFGKKLVTALFTKSTESIYNAEWKTETYSIPYITLDTPVELKKSDEIDDELPQEVKDLILTSGSFMYDSSNFSVIISTVSYVPAIQVNPNDAIEGAMEEIEKEPEISNFSFSTNSYNRINGLPGILATGEMTEDGTNIEFQAVYLGTKNHLWSVFVAYKKGDENGEKIAEKMLNSIEIDEAYVE